MTPPRFTFSFWEIKLGWGNNQSSHTSLAFDCGVHMRMGVNNE